MFIPDFWCGVGATILTEIIVIAVLIVICAIRQSDDKEDKS